MPPRRGVCVLAAAGVRSARTTSAGLGRAHRGLGGGLRLAAMSLSRHDAPGRFVAEFSAAGTVADYLVGEVLASLAARGLVAAAGAPASSSVLLARSRYILIGLSVSARLLHDLE